MKNPIQTYLTNNPPHQLTNVDALVECLKRIETVVKYCLNTWGTKSIYNSNSKIDPNRLASVAMVMHFDDKISTSVTQVTFRKNIEFVKLLLEETN